MVERPVLYIASLIVDSYISHDDTCCLKSYCSLLCKFNSIHNLWFNGVWYTDFFSHLWGSLEYLVIELRLIDLDSLFFHPKKIYSSTPHSHTSQPCTLVNFDFTRQGSHLMWVHHFKPLELQNYKKLLAYLQSRAPVLMWVHQFKFLGCNK